MPFRVVIVFVCVFLSISSFSQNKIRWMTWEEVLAKNEKTPRKIFVDVYTEWCTWCKKMDASTFSEDKLAKYINENYYPVKFDAQFKEPINFNGQTFSFVKSFKGGYHELAAYLLQGKMSYPTLVFLDENLQVIQAIQGFQGSLEFEMIITFFGGDFYKTTPWRKYTRNFVPIDRMSYPVGGKN